MYVCKPKLQPMCRRSARGTIYGVPGMPCAVVPRRVADAEGAAESADGDEGVRGVQGEHQHRIPHPAQGEACR